MPELSGPIQPVELASWLWLLLFFPLLGALTNALYGSGLLQQLVETLRAPESASLVATPRRPQPPATARFAVLTLSFAFATALVFTCVLFQRSPEERYLLRPLWQMVRVGPLDVGADLAFDPLSAAMALVVTGLGALVCLYASRSKQVGVLEHDWRFFVCFEALILSVLVVVLADNAFFLLLGWQATAASGYGLVAATHEGPPSAEVLSFGSRAFVVQRLADAALALGFALLFWGLGGVWDRRGDYHSELNPRLVAVAVVEDHATLPRDDPGYYSESAVKGTGFLTITALPDSLVYMDESRTPLLDASGVPLRTPFRRHPLPGGAHSLRIAPDDTFHTADHDAKVPFVLRTGALTNYLIPRTGFGADHEVAITLLGPTLRFREMRDQLVLSDAAGARTGRDGFLVRRLGGPASFGSFSLLSVACFLILLGALVKSAQLPFHGWLVQASSAPASVSALLQGCGAVLTGTYLLVRLSFLFTFSVSTSIAVAAIGLVSALFGAFASASQRDVRRLLAYGTVSQGGLAFVALGVGAGSAAVLQVVVHALAMTCLLLTAGVLASGTSENSSRGSLEALAARARSTPILSRAYWLGCVALTGVPLPLLSGFWSSGAIADPTLATSLFPAPVATVVSALVLVTFSVTSFALWRSYFIVFSSESPSSRGETAKSVDAEPITARIVTGLGGLAVVVGLVLGASARDFGGSGESVLEAWLAPSFATVVSRFEDVFFGQRMGVHVVCLLLAYAGWALARRRHAGGRQVDVAGGSRAPQKAGSR